MFICNFVGVRFEMWGVFIQPVATSLQKQQDYITHTLHSKPERLAYSSPRHRLGNMADVRIEPYRGGIG